MVRAYWTKQNPEPKSSNPCVYTVGSISQGQFKHIATITLVSSWDNAIFKAIDTHIRERLSVLIASPTTKPDPEKFQMEGSLWLV